MNLEERIDSIRKLVRENPLKRLLKLYPNKKWDWHELSMNPCTDIEIILKNMDKKLYWTGISSNPKMTLEIIKKYIDFSWDWCVLSNRFLITDILTYPNLPWDWFYVSKKSDVTMDIVRSHPNLPWNLVSLMFNINTDINMILENINKVPSNTLIDGINVSINDIITNIHLNWNWIVLSKYKNIEDILMYPDLPWNWVYVCQNPTLNMDIIRSRPEIPWYYDTLSYHPKLTIKFILENFDKDWIWYGGVSANPAISFEDKIKHLNLPWDWTNVNWMYSLDMIEKYQHLINWNWNSLSCNIYITLDFVLKHIDKTWNWYELSRHPNITMNDILEHPELPWKFHELHFNPNLTVEAFQRYKSILDLKFVSRNKYDHHLAILEKKEFLKKYNIYKQILRFKRIPDDVNSKILNLCCL